MKAQTLVSSGLAASIDGRIGVRSGNPRAYGALCSLWAAYLAFPLHCLKSFQLDLLGLHVPVYHFIVVPPALALAAYAILTKISWSKEEIAWWALPCFLLPSVLSSSHGAWSLREWMSWLARGFAIGGSFFIFRPGFARMRRIMSFVYLVVMGSVLFGFLELYLGYNPIINIIAHPPPFNLTSRLLPMGTQGNRIPYIACLVPFFPIALWKLKVERARCGLHAACAMGLYFLVLVSQVRSSWVGLVVAAALYFRWIFNEYRRLVLSCLAAALAILTINLCVPHFRVGILSRAESMRVVPLSPAISKAGTIIPEMRAGEEARIPQGAELAIRHRLASYKVLGALRGHWLFGIGYGEYPQVYRAYYDGPLPDLDTPDNQYLRWFIETGVLGSLGLFGFLAVIIVAGWRSIRRMSDPREADLYTAILCGWAGMAMTFMFFDGFYWGACNMTFWSFLGLFAACLGKDSSGSLSDVPV